MSESRQMQMVWNVDQGSVIFAFPSDMTDIDINDVEALLAITVRGMRRRAAAATPTPETPDHD